MSDASKTAELIAYARKWIKLHRENKYQREAAKIMTSVVDALESATRIPEQGEASGINLFRDLGYDESSPEVIQARESVALEAATSVPVQGERELAAEAWAIRNEFLAFWGRHSANDIAAVGYSPRMPETPILDRWHPRDGSGEAVQGEPNDDREAIDAEAFRQYPARDNFGVPDLRVFAFKAGAEWMLSRTTVPDAATEAVERVRAIHEPIPIYEGAESCGHTDDEHTTFESDQGIVLCENSPLGYSICGGCSDDSSADGPVEHPCPTISALDGAPELAGKEYRRVKPDGFPVYHATFESMPTLDEGWSAEYRSFTAWLPAEGESK